MGWGSVLGDWSSRLLSRSDSRGMKISAWDGRLAASAGLLGYFIYYGVRRDMLAVHKPQGSNLGAEGQSPREICGLDWEC